MILPALLFVVLAIVFIVLGFASVRRNQSPFVYWMIGIIFGFIAFIMEVS